MDDDRAELDRCLKRCMDGMLGTQDPIIEVKNDAEPCRTKVILSEIVFCGILSSLRLLLDQQETLSSLSSSDPNIVFDDQIDNEEKEYEFKQKQNLERELELDGIEDTLDDLIGRLENQDHDKDIENLAESFVQQKQSMIAILNSFSVSLRCMHSKDAFSTLVREPTSLQLQIDKGRQLTEGLCQTSNSINSIA